MRSCQSRGFENTPKKALPSQMEFGFKTGMDRTYIGGIERSERNVALRNIEKIAKAFGIGIDELFKP